MKILVVDDEPNVSTGIKDFLLESDLDVTHVETALNGFEAIDYLRMDTFDLVLTDIQMGRMSGIELMETIRMEQPELPFVVISAHEKFDFAAKSLRLGAHDYLVKPVERDDLLRVVSQVLRQKEEHGKQSLARIERADAMSVNEMLQELVTDRNLTRQDYEMLASELGDRFQGRSFGVLALRLNLRSGGFSNKEISLPDRKLLKYASVNILEESLSEWHGLTFNGYGNELVAIIQLQDREVDGRPYPLKSQLQLIGQMIHMNLKQYLNVDATVGMSTLHTDVFMLPKLMEEANTAAEWKNLHPNHKVLYYEDAIRYENMGVVEWIGNVDRYVQLLKSKLEDGSPVDTRAVVHPLSELAETEDLFNSHFGMLAYRIYALLLEFGHAGGVSLHRFDPDLYFRGLTALEKPNRLDGYIQEVVQAMRSMVRDRERRIIARIVGYIREHYRNPALKIQDIADEVHFSTTYLSYLFKREMKKNIWDFVTELRIDAAKQLLATTDKKRYEISYEIGYESPEHFGRMFKRYAGVSPAEYRKDHGGSGLKLKVKVTLAFALFIVGPFLIVGWISAYKGSESMSNEVGRTTLQLVKQNHVTLEKTLSSVNERMITLLDNHFFSDVDQYEFWTRIETLGEITEADAILERWASDGTEITLYMANKAGKRTPFDLSAKSKGFKYFDENRDGALEWAERMVREGGAGTLRLTAKDNGSTTVSLMRSILNPKSYDETIGFLIVSKLEVLLNRDLVAVQLPENASIFLYNGSSELLMKTGAEQLDGEKLTDVVKGKKDGYYYAREGGRKWLYAYSSLPFFDTRLVYKIPFESMTAGQSEFQWILMGASAVYMALVLFFVLYLLRMIVKPLVKLVSLTKIYEPGKKLDWDDDQLRKDEFGILYGAFKKMTTRLDHSIEEYYGMKIQQKEVELSTLHSQITPHLLYNTLDSIYWYALSSGNTDVGDMVKDLSKLLRIGLSKGKTVITIGEELEHVQAYSRLQQKRYPNTLEIHWDVDETLLSCASPKVIIQPLVENAIFHGVSGMDGEGEIWVRIARGEGEILVSVEDNGFLPVDMTRLESILTGETSDKGYGIRNVHQRIRLHFGEAYGLRYERREGGGLKAVINMPLRPSAP